MRSALIVGQVLENITKKNKTYSLERDAGLFSNLNLAILEIFMLEKRGYEVENVVLKLLNYSNEDVYCRLFRKNSRKLHFEDIGAQDLELFEKRRFPCQYGLGDNLTTFNFSITSRIIEKFFEPNEVVMKCYCEMIRKLDLEKSTFIWARRTDKNIECEIPSTKTYFELIQKIVPKNNSIIIQTDDEEVFKEFRNLDLQFQHFSSILFSENDQGFHNNIDNTGHSGLEHLKQMLSLVIIAKNSGSVILYPGNLTTFIPMFRESFKNCHLFRNEKDLFKLQQ